jgi:hypothetical protein
MREFRALKDDVEVTTIRGAGSTYCMITKPRECSEAVIDYLAGVGRRSGRRTSKKR